MSERVVAFGINADRTGPQAGLTVQMPSVPVAVPAPVRADTAGTPTAQSRAMNRARIGAVYAGLLGEDISAADLFEQLQIAAGTEAVTLEDLRTGLVALGLTARIQQPSTLEKADWPALAQMKSGQIVLVLRASAEGLEVYDPTCPDNRAEVTLADFAPVFAGSILRARTRIEDLSRRHSDRAKPHWFWGEFAKYRRQLLEVALGSMVANILAVSVALFSLQVYDRVIPHKSEPTLWVLALGAFLAVALEGALKMARSGLMDMTGRRIELTMQEGLMRKLLGMKHSPATRSPSQVFSAMREFSSVREFFTASTIGTLADIPFVLIFLVLVASIGGNLVWILVIGGALMVLPGFLFQKRMIALTQATQGAGIRSSKLLYEAVYDQETLSTQRGEDRVARLWQELVTLTAVKSSEQRSLSAGLTYWAQGVQQATYVLAVVAGAYMVFAGDFTIGTIIAISILTGRTLGPLSQLSATLARWSNVKAALIGLDAIAGSKQAEEEGRHYLRRGKLTGRFELRHVEFRYDPQSAATIEIPACAIPAGQHVAVLGSNGSGKSTLLKVMAGLYEPTAGRLLIDGVDMGQVHPRDLRRGIGYLGQDVRLFSGTLRDNLNLSQLERDDDRLFRALDFAGLGPFLRNHPRGLDLEIKELGEGLSVGQRQSLGWARMWLQDPQIVLLDEPTAALDQTLEATLVSRLGTWLEGRTAIIATHRIPILQLTSRTLILQNGKLAVDGPRDAVLAHLSKAQAPDGGSAG